jgi:hypothetical protein
VIDSELVDAVREHSVILFVGAGVSANLDLPTHARLIEIVAEELGYDPDIFARLGSHLELAEYYESQTGSLGALLSKLDREWHDSRISVRSSRVHRLIPELQAPIIYTTNYDRWLEVAYEELGIASTPVVTVADMKKVTDGVTQIVKFHGDFDSGESIVLTEASYFDRLDFEGPLDLKLRADSLARPILFLGYSLADVNMRLMTYKLAKLWVSAGVRVPRPRSFVVLDKPNRVQETILKRRGIEPIVTEGGAGEGLRAFLSQLIEEALGKKLTGDW